MSSEQEVKFSALLKIRELDLNLHYLGKHKRELFSLRLGKRSMENRTDYEVELSKHDVAIWAEASKEVITKHS